MKKFLGTRIGVILITALVCVIAFGGIAYAANYTKTVSVSGTVVTANPEIGVYSDEACTIPVTSLGESEPVQGESYSYKVYLKNIGNKNLSGINFSASFPSDVGTITKGVNDLVGIGLDKGQSTSVTIIVSFLPDATLGAINGSSISFSGTY